MTLDQIASLFDSSPLWYAVGIIFILNLSLIILEISVDYFSTEPRIWKDTGANVIIFFLGQVIDKLITGTLGLLALLPFYYLVPWEIPMNIWTFLLALLAADLSYYWMHRIEHEHRILWALHSVHHSSRDYNLSISLRLSIVEGFIEWVFLVPMILLGFDPFTTIVSFVFVVQYQTWIHTRKINRLGFLDRWFNTPSVHRVHHGSNPQYLDKNYAGILLIWDRLFGTYEPENEKVVYGLTNNIGTNNPLKINFLEFGNIWKEVKQCRNARDKRRLIFGSPNWKPKYFEEKSTANPR